MNSRLADLRNETPDKLLELKMSIVSPTAESVRPSPPAAPSWRQAMKQAIRDPAELVRLLNLPDHFIEPASQASRQFGLFAPREFVARMRPGDPRDPLLRQVLPLSEEQEPAPGFTRDPVGDLSSAKAPGLLHKYQGRALLVVTGACPVHCRYCFRRHFPYSDGPRSVAELTPALEAITEDNSIREVILSGGDPLTVADGQLSELASTIAAISHVERLRVHTRMPITIPQRVTGDLLGWLAGTRLAPVVVVHTNHPREIDEAVGRALQAMSSAGLTLLNQTVLLAGVNDDADVLVELSQRLFRYGVLPYYLHQLDRVAGAAHFEASAAAGRAIVKQMRQRLPGYLVPRYVREIAGEAGKTVLA